MFEETWIKRVMIEVVAYLLRFESLSAIRWFLFYRYAKNIYHAGNLMRLLHDESIQGWAYPDEVRYWAHEGLSFLSKHPVAFKRLLERPWSRSEGWEHYLAARNDFRPAC
tara:strand:- start:234657 stop:234986 length:330 start_codon:yes stop_codon:yes gene_type:complete